MENYENKIFAESKDGGKEGALNDPVNSDVNSPVEFPDEEAEISNKEIESLEVSIEKILKGFMVKQVAKNLDLIIGDDASGRIPTLVISKFYNSIAEKVGREKPEIRTIFIAGGTKDVMDPKQLADIKQRKKEEIKNLIEKQAGLLEMEPKKMAVSVVTDVIFNGNTLELLTEALKEMGIRYNILSVSLAVESKRDELEKKLGGYIKYGDEGIPGVWQKYRLAGVVRKQDAGEIFAKPITQGQKEEIKKEMQEDINTARNDVNILAEKLVNKFIK